MNQLSVFALCAALLAVALPVQAMHECASAREFEDDISLPTSKFGDVTVKDDATVSVEGEIVTIVQSGKRDVDIQVEYFETGNNTLLVQVLINPGDIECIGTRRRDIMDMLNDRFGRQVDQTCIEATAENEQTREREFFQLCEETQASFGSAPFGADVDEFMAGSFELSCGQPDADNMNGRLAYDFGHNIIISGDAVIDDGNMLTFEWEDVPPPPGKSSFGSELILHLMLDKALTKVHEGLTEVRSHLEYIETNLPAWEETAGEDYVYPFIGLNSIAQNTWDFYTCLQADPCDCKPEQTGEESLDFATASCDFNDALVGDGSHSGGGDGNGDGSGDDGSQDPWVTYDDMVQLDDMVTIH